MLSFICGFTAWYFGKDQFYVIPILLDTDNTARKLLASFIFQHVIKLEKGLDSTRNCLDLMISAAGYYFF